MHINWFPHATVGGQIANYPKVQFSSLLVDHKKGIAMILCCLLGLSNQKTYHGIIQFFEG